jgi:TetR/AcrR family transcriptional repressor of nem operon
VRYSKKHKQETRDKIVQAAARLFRANGYDGVGVDRIMEEVGLTAGGFYSHFPSKEALFAEAVAAALGSSAISEGKTSYREAPQLSPPPEPSSPNGQHLGTNRTESGEAAKRTASAQIATHPAVGDPLRMLINSYLSRTHRDHVAEGCPLPALTPDVARGGPAVRENYELQLRRFAERIQVLLGEPSEPTDSRAFALLAQCVGGLMLARAVNDQDLSNRILKASRVAAVKISRAGSASNTSDNRVCGPGQKPEAKNHTD